MRIFRVHLEELAPGPVTVTGSAAHHLGQVLRSRPGQKVIAFDGKGSEADGTVTAVTPGRVTIALGEIRAGRAEAGVAVTVAVALLKGDRLRTVVRQGTELGAVSFRPFVSRHAELRELSPARLDRLQRVAAEAARQSGRAVIPEVHAAVSVEALAADLSGSAVIYADPLAEATLGEVRRTAGGDVTVITGPEGGFAETEIALFREHGFTGVWLGTRILRAETAPPALLAALLLPEAL